MGRGRWPIRLFGTALVVGVVTLSGCAGAPAPSPHASRPSVSPSATATPAPTSVTVIAPLGVNLRTGPSTSASSVGVVSQGVSLPIVSRTSASGGWWEVRGSSQTGWITADPQYTSTGSFQTFAAPGATPWSVMYPAGWTFAQASSGSVVFTGPVGSSITFLTATAAAQLPAAAPPGAVQSGVGAVEVFGVTAPLVTYTSTSHYQASVEFQAQPALAFLIQAQLPLRGGAGTLGLFLETVSFTPAASPTP
ncbi:MAG TPA: SH3 domain-containing protein [Candidatus Dormibacteraeota bacterium]|nr:SH3 domain-containing protein [Candidatus Dormibacteraeota bacterium]